MIKHNAEVGSKIAVELANLRQSERASHSVARKPDVRAAESSADAKRPVGTLSASQQFEEDVCRPLSAYEELMPSLSQIVVGGVNADFTITFTDENIKVRSKFQVPLERCVTRMSGSNRRALKLCDLAAKRNDLQRPDQAVLWGSGQERGGLSDPPGSQSPISVRGGN